MESLNVAVIGANGVGKSHFIQRAMGLARVPGPDPTTARISIDNVSFLVTLFELDLEYFDIDPQRQVQWPKQMGGTILPRVNGALFLYDVTNEGSVTELPQTLNALVNPSLPAVLVATKCDHPEALRTVNTESVAAACPQCVTFFTTSNNRPDAAKMALSTLLKAIVVANSDPENPDNPGLRRRAASEAGHLDAPLEPIPRPISQHSKHSRASSDMSLLRNYLTIQDNNDYRHPRMPRGVDLLGGQIPDDDESSNPVGSLYRNAGVRARHIYLEVEDSDGDSIRYSSDDVPLLQRGDENLFDRGARRPGVTLDELVDRLLGPKLSRADQNFADVFLCLYRKFATPGELFSAIHTRLQAAKEDKGSHYLTRISTQLRIIEAVAKWVATYPNDFAKMGVRKRLEALVSELATDPIFSAAALQMRKPFEGGILEDDDAGWVKSEDEDTQAESDAMAKASRDSLRPVADIRDSLGTLSIDDAVVHRPSRSSSMISDPMAPPAKTHSFQFHSYEDYEREAATMTPSSTLPLTKFRYHIFMDTSNDDIADEMTRIDWVMFSSIRIRDLVRHVSLSGEQRAKCKAMNNVNRMIEHFNHIAIWVSNMILMRDKAKHRAQMLEKFMQIALKLRVLNNYNGLAAVLAGINGTAIHRLTQTNALVSTETKKRFARLGLLMGTSKGHFAYRLAWENSPLPRIPFIPLHRRDLVSAEEGSITFVGPQGDRLNWKKFEVLGEVILPIMKSQSMPYPNLSRHDPARELILDCLMPTDEEEIYIRSLQVEKRV